jgi:hypothetical protein
LPVPIRLGGGAQQRQNFVSRDFGHPPASHAPSRSSGGTRRAFTH